MSFNKVDQSTGDLEQIAGAQNMLDYARKSASNTFTGQQVINANEVVIKSSNIDKDTPPSSSTDGNAFIPFADKDGDAYAVVYTNQRTDGTLDLHIDTFAQNNPNGKVVVNGIDIDRLSRIGGDSNFTWVDLLRSQSTSGKMTRLFLHDADLFVGSQVWNENMQLTKEGKFYFQPAPQQITLLNGITTSEQVNCNYFDFGAFFVVNLAGVVVPSGWVGGTPMFELPGVATARLNFRVPTSTAGGEIMYIDANSNAVRLTGIVDVPIYTNIIIPTTSARS